MADTAPPAAVLDASVAVRWVVAEEGSEEAAALLESDTSWIAPRLLLTEVASRAEAEGSQGALAAAAAAQALDAVLQGAAESVVQLVEDEQIVTQALLLAISLEHRVPGSLYLALAEREGAAIATADDRLSRLARARGVTVLEVPHR